MFFEIAVIFILSNSLDSILDVRIKNDKTLLAPGFGAENVLLNGEIDEIIDIKGYPEKVSEFKERRELFGDVFAMKAPIAIYFDKIYYYDSEKAIIFFSGGCVSAIAGLSIVI